MSGNNDFRDLNSPFHSMSSWWDPEQSAVAEQGSDRERSEAPRAGEQAAFADPGALGGRDAGTPDLPPDMFEPYTPPPAPGPSGLSRLADSERGASVKLEEADPIYGFGQIYHDPGAPGPMREPTPYTDPPTPRQQTPFTAPYSPGPSSSRAASVGPMSQMQGAQGGRGFTPQPESTRPPQSMAPPQLTAAQYRAQNPASRRPARDQYAPYPPPGRSGAGAAQAQGSGASVSRRQAENLRFARAAQAFMDLPDSSASATTTLQTPPGAPLRPPRLLQSEVQAAGPSVQPQSSPLPLPSQGGTFQQPTRAPRPPAAVPSQQPTAASGPATASGAGTPGIPASRERSLERVITETIESVQTSRRSKTGDVAVKRFQGKLRNDVNAKAGREPVDPEAATKRYLERAGERAKLPAQRKQSDRNWKAERAQQLGVGSTAAEYNRHIHGQRAKKLGVGSTDAEYKRHMEEERAKGLDVGDTAADYRRHSREKLAKELGVGDTAADYNRHRNARRAQELGVGDTNADYQQHIGAKLAKKKGVGTTSADYQRHMAELRAKKLGVGDRAADYKRFTEQRKKARELESRVVDSQVSLRDPFQRSSAAPLTGEQQQGIFSLYTEHFNGRPETIRQIAQQLGLPEQQVADEVQQIEHFFNTHDASLPEEDQ